MTRLTIICVDDESMILVALREQLDHAFPDVVIETAADGAEALELLDELEEDEASCALVISDQIMPELKGDELLARIHERWPRIKKVMLTGQADSDAVGRAVNAAALYRYLAKPWTRDDLVLTVRGALEAFDAENTRDRLLRELEAEVAHRTRVSNELLRQANERTLGPLLGTSDAVGTVLRRVAEHARSDAAVLLLGSPGSGFEATARAIHVQSQRAAGPFQMVNAALVSIDDERWTSHWMVARGGTLYMHGVERLSPSAQARIAEIIRASREGSADVPDLRVVASALSSDTHDAALEPELSEAFAGLSIHVPPLRDRVRDIATIAEHYLRAAAERTGRPAQRLSSESLARLERYPWPGNVLELRQVIQAAVMRSKSEVVDVDAALLEQGSALGSYRLLEKLGHGGMGVVWRATHQHLARPAAVKLLRGDSTSDEALERFRREASAIASLRSPHTIELYDFGVADDGQLYFVMELLEGLDLQRMLDEHGPLPQERVVFLLRQACRSLAEAHAAGLVHRDIKPANLFVGHLGLDADFLKVLDFGMVAQDEPSETPLTGDFATPGTPAYMAPEVAFGDTIDARADLYGLACVAFWMLTGQLVFPGKTFIAMAMGHAQREPPTFSSVGVDGVHEGLEALLRRCLAKDPADRPPTAMALERELAALPLEEPWTLERARSWWAERAS